MAKKKLRKTLPKNLAAMITEAEGSGDYSAVYGALEACEPNAYNGYGKSTALHMYECTPELAKWLVARGTDVNAEDRYGKTPLHKSARAGLHSLPPQELIKLGADVHRQSSEGLTALHCAADGKNLPSVKALLEHNADPKAESKSGLTPLGYALTRLSNAELANIVPVAEVLLQAGDRITPAMQESVRRVAENFEFHRAGFNTDSIDEVSAGQVALCVLTGVTPPKPRLMHDGSSPIIATGPNWQAQHQELWALLVPSSGPCETVQGEVIRISGRIADEMHRNGGANWARQYPMLTKELGRHLASHNSLDKTTIQEANRLIGIVRSQPDGTTERLMELAVQWVALNPTPHVLTQ